MGVVEVLHAGGHLVAGDLTSSWGNLYLRVWVKNRVDVGVDRVTPNWRKLLVNGNNDLQPAVHILALFCPYPLHEVGGIFLLSRMSSMGRSPSEFWARAAACAALRVLAPQESRLFEGTNSLKWALASPMEGAMMQVVDVQREARQKPKQQRAPLEV